MFFFTNMWRFRMIMNRRTLTFTFAILLMAFAAVRGPVLVGQQDSANKNLEPTDTRPERGNAWKHVRTRRMFR